MGFVFNFIKRFIILFVKFLLYFGIVATIIVLIPNLPPYTKFTKIVISPEQPRVGPLAPNSILNNAEQKFKGKLIGPEAFQIFNGDLYTGVGTGEIVKISPAGHITFVTKIGQPCTGLTKSHICGRPLGFEIDEKHNTLYVADAYYGIWKVDLKTDKKQLLVSPRVEIKRRLPKLFNSIVLSNNGDFYWTDSTSDYYLHDGALGALSDPSGRVFHYDAAKNESKLLIDDLWFANGLALSPKGEFLVVAETSQFRLLKHYISGPKKGQTEVFVDGLPGTPDNVRVLPDGTGILVGLYTVNDDEYPLIQRSLASTPVLRKFLARLQRLIEFPFEYLNSVYPHVVFEEIVHHIGHFKSVSAILPPTTGLLQVDWNGNIVASYFNTDRSMGHISEGIVYNGKLYTGSPNHDFIGVIPVPPLLKKAFEATEKVNAPKAPAKPTEQVKPKVVEIKPKADQIKPKKEEKPKVVQKPPVEQKQKEDLKPKVEQKPKVENKPKVEQKPTEEKPKVVTPKVEQKPKEEKPKVETPKVDNKPKVEQKPKVETKSKAEEKKDLPKAATVEKQQAKKDVPVTPVQVKAPEPVTTTTPPPKTTAPPVKTEAPKTTAKPQTTSTPKPETKPTEKTTPTPPKKNTEPPKTSQDTTKPAQPKEIPIKEEIISDTAKPPKEKLKVIKKGGVTAEIPVPNSL